MLPRSVTEIADQWWCRDFACTPDGLRPPAPHVQTHKGDLTGNTGIWILLVGEFPVISISAASGDQVATRARRWTSSTILDQAALMNELEGCPVQSIVGPAFIGYATDTTFRSPQHPAARPLTLSDRECVQALRAGCTAPEWEHGGSALGEVPTFGAFTKDGQLAALAGYKIWGGKIAHLSIVTTSSFRTGGFGTAAVAAAANSAAAAGLLPQYRTLMSNTPSMRIAEKLGFEHYGVSVYVRMLG